MAASDKYTLDLSSARLKKLEKRDGVGIKYLILDNNELTKLENLEFFVDVEKISACGNLLIRMYGVSKCRQLTHLNLSNNHLVCIEGLKDLINLNFLNLAVNNIKSIQNLQNLENLTHLDLSKNNILSLSAVQHLNKLKVFHLSGNKISSLTRASLYLPASLCALSLADNCITDLNEISNLVGLESLEQLTIAGNPCVMPSNDLPAFDYRPFIINWCLGLRLLDGYVATQKESLKAEWLYSQGRGRHFKLEEHTELVEYLSQVCPLNSDQLVEEEDEKLSRILHMQRQHKEQFLNDLSQSVYVEQPTKQNVLNKMSQSFHSHDSTLPYIPTTRSSSCGPSRIMYESAPEVLFQANENELHITPPLSHALVADYPQQLSKSEILHNSAHSPITIEQVPVAVEGNKVKCSQVPKPSSANYEDRRLTPSNRELNTTHAKGTLIRKVSKRSPSPVSSSPPGKMKIPSSIRSRISPSRSCTINSNSLISKTSSGSDTSEEQFHSGRGSHRNVRQAARSQSQTSSPVYRQRTDTAVSKETEANHLKYGTNIFSPERRGLQGSKVVKASDSYCQRYRQTEDKLYKAAIRIQALWRGYHVRHCNQRVFKLRQEIRFRRMEDHIHHLHGHMCRLTDFVLRQQKDLQHERELRKMQAEDIQHLHEKTKDLQNDVSVIIMKSKQNEVQKVSEQDSYVIQNSSFSRSCISNDCPLPRYECSRTLQDLSPDTPSSSIQFSCQTYQDNSGLFSPSSQISSVASLGPECTYGQTRTHVLPVSTSDLSDVDSGLQSMMSPNFPAFVEVNRNSATKLQSGCLEDQQCSDAPITSSPRGGIPNSLPERISSVVNHALCKRNIEAYNAIKKDLYLSSSKQHTECNNSFDNTLPKVTEFEQSAPSSHLHAKNKYVVSDYIESPKSNFCPVIGNHSKHDTSYVSSFQDDNSIHTREVADGLVGPPTTMHFEVPVTDMKENERGIFRNRFVKDASQQSVLHHSGRSVVNISTSTVRDQYSTVGTSFQDEFPETDKCKSVNILRTRPSILAKEFAHAATSSSSTPLISPQSPCKVEMSGRISHSCSFQSDGFTAAEELSAMTTVKLFSARTMSLACSNNVQSPQTSIPRPLTLSEPVAQATLHSPFVLTAVAWEKKVQDIESTFQQLQSQIRDLEGVFGQGQIESLFHPSILSDEVKEPKHLIHCLEPNQGALPLDMKGNFKPPNGNSDFLIHSQFLQRGTSALPLMPLLQQQQQSCQSAQSCENEDVAKEPLNSSDSSKCVISRLNSNSCQGNI